ncbi:hypothetical protein [Oceanihabitans sediminis]|uniref:hypothetical protein n=1 Tax=Oceanihabitans sediminis TaxID=1812012 RepID=UPI00299CEE91|nr:hypothetical protein [Oceanihabitans sediminis]MDX1279121.1 hypothetical protein [Oceanihabitans sediminis]
MLTDKQSLLLCGAIFSAFVIFGILDILSNYFLSSLLVIGFLLVIVNLIITKRTPEEEDIEESFSSKDV